MKEVSYQEFVAMSPNERRQCVTDHVALLVAATPLDNEVLLSLARSLGNVSGGEERAHRENQEPGGVYLVRAREIPLTDAYGNPVMSTSREAFPLHTDEFFRHDPSDVVMMLCFASDADGGDTLISDVDTIVASLSLERRDALGRSFVRVPFGFTSVLSAVDPGGYRVTYNRREIDKFCHTLNYSYPPIDVALLDEFDVVAHACAAQFRLRVGDCLVLDNRRALHGRTRIAAKSNRLLKRVRVRLTPE